MKTIRQGNDYFRVSNEEAKRLVQLNKGFTYASKGAYKRYTNSWKKYWKRVDRETRSRPTT